MLSECKAAPTVCLSTDADLRNKEICEIEMKQAGPKDEIPYPEKIGTIYFKSGGDDTTAEWLHVYLHVSRSSVSTEYGVGSIINNILFETDSTTGYI